MTDCKTYRHEEVLALIKSFQATTDDYVVQTYFRIFDVSEGPLYSKFQRRFNNVVFNNLSEISRHLTLTLFQRRADEILKAEMSSVKYLSCIHPNRLFEDHCPIFVQYFKKDSGLERRLVGISAQSTSLSTVLHQCGVLGKIVGYCGDFSYRDPAGVVSSSDHLSTLKILNGSPIADLPFSDGFIETLFDVLVSYFPEDVVAGLKAIGDTMLGMNSNSRFADKLVAKYRQWLRSDRHILSSNYADFVVNNLDSLNAYLLPFDCLPRSIAALLSSTFNRFVLVFATHLYRKIAKIKLSDNNAVVYYFHLRKIRDTFVFYEENHYIPTKAYNHIDKEVEALIANKQLHLESDQSKIDNLNKAVVLMVDHTYARAVKYIEPLIRLLEESFGGCSWFLLQGAVDVEEIHHTWHRIQGGDSCEPCRRLMEEVKQVNAVLPNLPILEIVKVEVKWMRVLKECEVPMISDLVEYLFSLPASCRVGYLQSEDVYQRTKSIIKDNMKNISPETVVDCVEEFFGRHLDDAKKYIESNTVPLLID